MCSERAAETQYTDCRKGGIGMKKYVVSNGCCYCGECLFVCPAKAITMDKNGAHIDPDACIGCGQCARNCASEAISEREV